MTGRKFDKTDRRAVAAAIEKHLHVSPSPVKRRKWFRDDSGRNYWIVGGYGEWHGIPEEMMDAEVGRPSGGYLVVATREKSAIQTYLGELKSIVENRDKLYQTKKTTGHYQFTFKKRASRIVIDQIPSIVLRDLTAFTYTDAQRGRDEGLRTAKRLLKDLSESQRRELMDELIKGT